MMVPLAKAMGGLKNVVPADDLLRPLYMKKTPAEIRCLRAAAKASEAGFKAVLEAIRPGMTEAELCGVATRAMTAAGAVERMREALVSDLSGARLVADAAQVAGMSPSRMRALFKKATGLSPKKYQMRARLVRAGRLLRETD